MRTAELIVAYVALLALAGCDQRLDDSTADFDRPPGESGQTGGGTATAQRDASLPFLLAESPVDDRALADAIAEAQRTAPEAREQWIGTPLHLRHLWAVKWASPTVEGGVEYVWVQPMRWSPFRIEGMLLSEPRAALTDGGSNGDTVSFPHEELADWVHVHERPRDHNDDAPATFDGGFTIRALQAK